jgi:hypothetical protein
LHPGAKRGGGNWQTTTIQRLGAVQTLDNFLSERDYSVAESAENAV